MMEITDDQKNCKHEEFEADLQVSFLEDTKRFMAEFKVRCAKCKVPFRFIGLPCGVDLNGASVNATGEEGHFAIAPRGQSLSMVEGALHGFTVRREP